MKLLLDTHTFLWWITDNPQLSQTARQAIAKPENDTYLSAASIWEIVIKEQLGKLTLPTTNTEKFISNQLAINAFQELPIHITHTLKVRTLPTLHRDPFDRILIAQAVAESMTLVSDDRVFASYPVAVLW